ncbi:filamin A-interacting protein 1-like [Kryptolebias marmoratus]|uniref:filamin A-interacting protein 1-like n=1 Tax=Kryptolebias marmoratus TaxID=37003 RepID=UPI0018ACB16D|nr:filamin A-interacting protein 1-like [Kryptolebias marmoratus]
MEGNEEKWKGEYSREDVSCDDLLLFLSILEGELQARDEVIAVLKSEKTDSVLLGAHYGLSRKEMGLRALQRDSLLAQQDHFQELSYSKETQRYSYKQMMEQLEEVCHSRDETLHKLVEREKCHKAFNQRRNCPAMLLEQDRERSVHQMRFQINA